MRGAILHGWPIAGNQQNSYSFLIYLANDIGKIKVAAGHPERLPVGIFFVDTYKVRRCVAPK
jgi:hypothetical protein